MPKYAKKTFYFNNKVFIVKKLRKFHCLTNLKTEEFFILKEKDIFLKSP